MQNAHVAQFDSSVHRSVLRAFAARAAAGLLSLLLLSLSAQATAAPPWLHGAQERRAERLERADNRNAPALRPANPGTLNRPFATPAAQQNLPQPRAASDVPRLSPGEAARRAQSLNGGGRVLAVEPSEDGYRVKLLKNGEVSVVPISH